MQNNKDEIIENDRVNMTRLESNPQPLNNTEESTVNSSKTDSSFAEAVSNSKSHDNVQNLETKKSDNDIKTRQGRGRHKHRAEDKSNEVVNVGNNYKEHVDGVGHTENNTEHSGSVGKWEKKLEKKKLEYKEQKHDLKQKLQDTKTKFQEEIKKYETDLSDKRREYLTQLTELQMDEEMQSMAKRMEELKELEDELDRRFKQCMDFETEIEQAEKYLDRRSEICKSREEQLKNLDEELDILHSELELDKERLQGSGVNVNSILTTKRGERFNDLQHLNDEDDYILKANLRKTETELKSTKYNLQTMSEQLHSVHDEVSGLKAEKKKNEQKIKHLETQLAVALGQLSQRNLASGNSTPTNKPKDQERYKSVHKHITLNRLNEDGLLSINQQAQLRRKNSSDRSSSSDGGRASRYSIRRNESKLTSGLQPGTSDGMGSSEGSGSMIGDHVVDSTVCEPASSKSTTCNVM
ncbi:uncharacterized protein [Antedon mediterranea]|uniref:uncharacterized protein isoform X2 n=1 Tax=Antedon mediterranea TaxID=105859 RepID=UPI003AF978C8